MASYDSAVIVAVGESVRLSLCYLLYYYYITTAIVSQNMAVKIVLLLLF